MKILFICTGNTCRSPMAQGLFKAMLLKEEIDNVEVESAGLSAIEGMPACENAIEALKEEGLDISTHSAKLITNEMLSDADLIVGVTPTHVTALVCSNPSLSSKIILLGDGIEDPYGMTLESYKDSRDNIKKALGELMTVVKRWNV